LAARLARGRAGPGRLGDRPVPAPALVRPVSMGLAARAAVVRLPRPAAHVDAAIRTPPLPRFLGARGSLRAGPPPPHGGGRRGGRRPRPAHPAFRQLVLHLLTGAADI